MFHFSLQNLLYFFFSAAMPHTYKNCITFVLLCKYDSPLRTEIQIVFFAHAALADGHGNLHQLVVVDHGITLLGKAEALMEQNTVLKDFLAFAADGYVDHITVFKTCALESFQGDIGPEVAEVGVVDLEVALHAAGLHIGLVDGMLHDLLHGILGAHALEVDDAGGKSGGGVAEQVTAVENGNTAGTLEAVDGLIDLTDRLDADELLYMGQGTVVGGDHIVAVHSLGNAGFAGSANTGVNHRYIDGTLGPELQALIQTVAGAPGVILGDLMGAVEDLQLPVHGLDHAVHGADSAFCVSKVGLENQNGLIKHTHIIKRTITVIHNLTRARYIIIIRSPRNYLQTI